MFSIIRKWSDGNRLFYCDRETWSLRAVVSSYRKCNFTHDYRWWFLSFNYSKNWNSVENETPNFFTWEIEQNLAIFFFLKIERVHNLCFSFAGARDDAGGRELGQLWESVTQKRVFTEWEHKYICWWNERSEREKLTKTFFFFHRIKILWSRK